MQRDSGQRDVTGDGVMALGDDFQRRLLEDRGSRKMKHSLQRPHPRLHCWWHIGGTEAVRGLEQSWKEET